MFSVDREARNVETLIQVYFCQRKWNNSSLEFNFLNILYLRRSPQLLETFRNCLDQPCKLMIEVRSLIQIAMLTNKYKIFVRLGNQEIYGLYSFEEEYWIVKIANRTVARAIYLVHNLDIWFNPCTVKRDAFSTWSLYRNCSCSRMLPIHVQWDFMLPRSLLHITRVRNNGSYSSATYWKSIAEIECFVEPHFILLYYVKIKVW